ncbi:uncharacterized protein METZ01_LOCUS484179, partial [marine metagenome]
PWGHSSLTPRFLAANYPGTLTPGTTYYVVWYFRDTDGNESWSPETSFTTNSPPSFDVFIGGTNSTPANGATGVAVDTNIVLLFNLPISVGTGNITIHKAADGSVVEAIPVTNGVVSEPNTARITLNPTADLAAGTSFYVNVDATAIDDQYGRSFAGISNATTFTFTTEAPGLPGYMLVAPQVTEVEATSMGVLAPPQPAPWGGTMAEFNIWVLATSGDLSSRVTAQVPVNSAGLLGADTG